MTRARLGASVVVLGAALALTGCGGDEPAAVAPSDVVATSAGGTASPSASETVSPTETPSASSGAALPGDTYADAEPATGPLFSHDGMSINAPAGWTGSGAGGNLVGPTADDVMQLERSTSTGDSTEKQAETALEFFGFTPGSQRLPDVTVLGQPAYHVSGTDEVFGNLVDQFGFSTASGDYLVRIATAQDLPQAEREQQIASSMVTLQVDGLS